MRRHEWICIDYEWAQVLGEGLGISGQVKLGARSQFYGRVGPTTTEETVENYEVTRHHRRFQNHDGGTMRSHDAKNTISVFPIETGLKALHWDLASSEPTRMRMSAQRGHI